MAEGSGGEDFSGASPGAIFDIRRSRTPGKRSLDSESAMPGAVWVSTFGEQGALKGVIDVAAGDWDWTIEDNNRDHTERVALLRPIPYELTAPLNVSHEGFVLQGRALSLNISSGGMLVLMDREPLLDQVLKVYVPTPITHAETPTLAEVRWTRRMPFSRSTGNGAYFVGLKFIF